MQDSVLSSGDCREPAVQPSAQTGVRASLRRSHLWYFLLPQFGQSGEATPDGVFRAYSELHFKLWPLTSATSHNHSLEARENLWFFGKQRGIHPKFPTLGFVLFDEQGCHSPILPYKPVQRQWELSAHFMLISKSPFTFLTGPGRQWGPGRGWPWEKVQASVLGALIDSVL